MNKCAMQLAHEYLSSVRPIYGSTDQGRPCHIGSCILLNINSRKMLLTAAHVIDESKVSTLYLAGGGELVPINGECNNTSSPDGDRHKDKFDFAFIQLSDLIVEKLVDCVFLTEQQLLNSGDQEVGGLYLALGYPNSKNKKVNNCEKKIVLKPLIYTSTLKHDELIFQRIGIKSNTHLLLVYKKKSKDEYGEIDNSVFPTGASGGGLFLVEGMTKLESYLPSAKCNGKLVGLLVEWHKDEKVIVATRMSQILSAINHLSFIEPN